MSTSETEKTKKWQSALETIPTGELIDLLFTIESGEPVVFTEATRAWSFGLFLSIMCRSFSQRRNERLNTWTYELVDDIKC